MPVLQACGRTIRRTILSKWIERKDAHYLLMEITAAQQEESPGQISTLQVHLFDRDTPLSVFQNNEVQDIPIPTFTWNSSPANSQVPKHLIHTQPMSLGSVTRRGFQLGFSFSGRCLLMTSIRVYYRRCPDIVFQLVSFGRTAAGLESQLGSCVKGAVEVSPPLRTCNEEGVWGPLQGGCTCAPGHQVMDNLCEGMENANC